MQKCFHACLIKLTLWLDEEKLLWVLADYLEQLSLPYYHQGLKT